MVAFNKAFRGSYIQRGTEAAPKLLQTDVIAVEALVGIMKIMTVKHGGVTFLSVIIERAKNSFSPVMRERKNHNLQKYNIELILKTVYNFTHLIEVIMAKGKENRIVITLECTEAKKEGKPVSRYTTTKNKKNTTERLILKKYNPNLQRHTLHKEIK